MYKVKQNKNQNPKLMAHSLIQACTDKNKVSKW